ncbi:hypothetical protein NP493_140g03054 [Ridgeia piscesae]|uniref:Importin N-terminal domain-containing protein n=1 Tax=Ridgeia piscesae TaxID=27915 RepID=A0AAD9UG45_RIDPI|nr:hypothetical protein NP493_140g03054 [Ridgeia piscesae]
MDVNKLVEVLQATLQPNQREEAERQLNEVHKIIGFVPTLLQVVMSDQLDKPVRQAGVIYLKNMVCQFWEEKEVAQVTDPVPFCIHETDKVFVREHIVETVIGAPEPVRVQLAVCISQLVKHDYPGKWPGIAEKVALYLQSDRVETWMGALVALYHLVKNFEYKKPEERGTLNQAMQVLLPLVHQRCVQLLPDESEMSVLLQKQILKIFSALTQYFLPLDLISKEAFTQWMELLRRIVERDVPEALAQVDEDDRPELPWWKCKKWALHILTRCFERYGSPGNVTKEYTQFSDWYLKSFSHGILQVLLVLLDKHRQKQYVSPRVLQLTLNYLNQGVSHSFSWKIMKPHMQVVIQEIVFPLMCHSDEDEELWHSDPVEYIRIKYDAFEEFFSPVTAAQGLLHAAASKRKEMLPKIMALVLEVLSSAELPPRQKAGALHVVGAIADILLTKKLYKSQAEAMLVTHVFPEFQSAHGYLRAMACWVLHCFCDVKFKNPHNLEQALLLTRSLLTKDTELPVQVEAAIALQALLTEQERAKDLLLPHTKDIVLELLKVVRETENEDLTGVLQKFVCAYGEEITPLAVEITTHLAHTFAQLLEGEGETSDEKAITAMGILNTMETIVIVMEDQKMILQHIEGVILNVIGIILQQNVIEFFEEMLSLVCSLTSEQVSDRMWNLFPMLYDFFQKDNVDYFTDMTAALHNYITVEPQKFLANPKHLEMIYNMCKTVLTSDAGEDPECHAAKLLEVILIQFKGQIDQVVPSFVELALERLTREVRTSELRTMCLQVVIAALYYSPPMLLETLEKMRLPNSTESITEQFLKQWIYDTDCFLGLHDRKICVLGLCALMATSADRSPAITAVSEQILPSCVLLFSGLQRAYAKRAQDEDEDDDDEENEDQDFEPAELEDEEDDIDEEGQQYLEQLNTGGGDDSEDDDEYDEAEETPLESYETPLDKEDCAVDEYQVFKGILQSLQMSDPGWYQKLTGHLTEAQKKEIQQIFVLADQRLAAKESKKIESAGGYRFANVAVPQAFNFGKS